MKKTWKSLKSSVPRREEKYESVYPDTYIPVRPPFPNLIDVILRKGVELDR